MLANYRIQKRWHVGEVVKVNTKTMLVKSPDGKVIKRHKVKHGAVIVEE